MVLPCLRWAGGKRWLIKYMDHLLPVNGFRNYHEPFLGGASIFLSLNVEHTAYLSDLNKELIDTYIAIRDIPEEVIRVLSTFKNEEKFYYQIRESEFENQVERAARFIYLNQTSFNGIYRVNLDGKYNVPYGYRKKDFLNKEAILEVSQSLQRAVLLHGDFEVVRNNLQPGDLVFLDPPYTVSHNNNGFVKYNQHIFSLEDQYRLRDLVDYIKSQQAYYILTNAAHSKIKEIFSGEDQMLELNRASLIGGTNALRGKTSEFVFTNIR